MSDIDHLKKELLKLQDKKKAVILQAFFKTGKGGYGEGDIFLGITVPAQRTVAKKYLHLTLKDLKKLLQSKIHEHRLGALLILVQQYKTADHSGKKLIADFYVENAELINNWDLVDTSAPYILGAYLFNNNKKILYKFARSQNLWKKRIAIISTYYFIRHNAFDDTFAIAEILLNDTHDLIHKAVGWMLREIGKRDIVAEITFLDKHSKTMPRTALRYAIERFEETKRRYYLAK